MKIKCREWRGEQAVYAHLKGDGHYTRVHKDDAGVVIVTSSQGTVLSLSARLLTNVHRLVPCGTTLLGELCVPSQPSSAVKTALIDGTTPLEIDYFAIESTIADASLEYVADQFTSWGLPFAPYLRLDKITARRDEASMREDLLYWAESLGGEGVVFKDGNLLNWRKLKRVRTADLLVVGTVDGEGKHLGLIGSLTCACREGVIVANASGMTDEQRVDMSLDTSLVGKIVEVEYQYVGAGGKLRHPRFKQIRDDKSGAEDITCRADL